MITYTVSYPWWAMLVWLGVLGVCAFFLYRSIDRRKH